MNISKYVHKMKLVHLCINVIIKYKLSCWKLPAELKERVFQSKIQQDCRNLVTEFKRLTLYPSILNKKLIIHSTLIDRNEIYKFLQRYFNRLQCVADYYHWKHYHRDAFNYIEYYCGDTLPSNLGNEQQL